MLFTDTWSFWYLCGAAEDAYIRTNPNKGYEFDLDSVSSEWLEQIQPLLIELINKEVAIRPHANRPHYRLRFFHKELVRVVKTIKDNPEQVRSIKPKFQSQWIAGFFDAEGSVTTTGTNQPMLSIYSTKKAKIDLIQEILDNASIHSGVYLPEGRSVYQLFITGRANIRKFFQEFPIRHPSKIHKIRAFF